MVEKKIKKIDLEYYTNRAVEKKYKPLFSSARTRKSNDINEAKNCKRIIEKKEITKFAVTKK